MIDFIKSKVTALLPKDLECNPLLDFYDRVNIATGEIKTINSRGQKTTPYKNAFYNGLEFRIYETGTITLAGSLHKYWNAGAHNFNDFNFDAFTAVLVDIKTKFNISAEQLVLKCLEVGVNFCPATTPGTIIDNSFLHKTSPFEYKYNSDEGKYKQIVRSQYIVKLYDKTTHYSGQGFENVPENLLRFEIKFTKMKKVNDLGIYTLRDIEKTGFAVFKPELILQWNNVLLFDETTVTTSRKLQDYSNPLYWQRLGCNISKSNFNKHKKNYRNLVLNHSENLHAQIENVIGLKVDLLGQKGARFYPLSILSIRTPLERTFSNRICEITGLNISMQKGNSILLSHTGLKYYHSTDRKTFEQIKRRYLSKVWQGATVEVQIREIAHNIRNTKSNRALRQSRIYNAFQTNLIDELQLQLAN